MRGGGKVKLAWAALTLGWLAAVAGGIKALQDYGSAAGAGRVNAQSWPAASSLAAPAERPSVVMFLHPECPCSRASLEELDRVLAAAPLRPRVYAVFVVPAGWSEESAQQNLWRRAKAMKNVQAVLDPEGKEARRFGAATSGQVYAYDDRGALWFAGGLTPTRGHEGENPGRDALVAFLRTGRAEAFRTWKVFGCSLFKAEKRT